MHFNKSILGTGVTEAAATATQPFPAASCRTVIYLAM